jgi:branched-chain amino acid transport system substrate-binding protein
MRRSSRSGVSRLGLQAAAVVAAAGIAATACSSSGKTGGTTGSTGTTAFTGTVKIGSVIWTTPLVDLSVRYPGIKAAMRAMNSAGGVNGKQLVFDNCEGTDPNSIEACARKLVSDGVVATVGDGTVIDDPGVEKILSAAGIPSIDPFAISPQTYSDPNVFMLSGGAPTQYAAIPQYMNALGLQTYHFVYGISPAATSNMDIVNSAAKLAGVTQKGAPTGVALTAADYSPAAASAASSGAQITIPVLAPSQTNLLVKAAQQLGESLRFGVDSQFTISQVQQWGQSGGPLSGALLADAVPPMTETTEFPALNTFTKDMNAEYQAGDSAAQLSQAQPLSLLGWLDIQVLAEVLKSGSGDASAASVKQGFETAKNLNTMGLTPPWTPSAQGPAQYPRISNPWMWLFTVKSGQFSMYQTKPISVQTALGG